VDKVSEVAEKALTDDEIQEQELAVSIAYCDKMIAEGDDLGMFAMIKRGLKSKSFEFEEWNKSIKEHRRLKL
jgi:hypothetical protein